MRFAPACIADTRHDVIGIDNENGLNVVLIASDLEVRLVEDTKPIGKMVVTPFPVYGPDLLVSLATVIWSRHLYDRGTMGDGRLFLKFAEHEFQRRDGLAFRLTPPGIDDTVRGDRWEARDRAGSVDDRLDEGLIDLAVRRLLCRL